MTATPVCVIEDCDGQVAARGWCEKHYRRWQRLGDPEALVRRMPGAPAEPCTVEGCEHPQRKRGWCVLHYERWRRHGDPCAVEVNLPPRPEGCSVDGCDRPHDSRGWCALHYRRWWKNGDPLDYKRGPHNKTTLTCEFCGADFEEYLSAIKARQGPNANGPRFCSAECWRSTWKGPRCSKCGGPNTRGDRKRLCEACADASPAARKQQRARRRLAECPDDKRWCTTCDEFLAPEEFPSADHQCGECRGRSNLVGHLARTYGITEEQHQALLAAAGGRCSICGKEPKKSRLHVDHDHKTGLIRGLLCTWCNHRLLPGARDSLDVLRGAVAYLESPPAVSVLGERCVPEKPKKKRRKKKADQ